MLQAEELMIGDYVLRTNGPEIIPVKVLGVKKDKYSLTIDNMHGQRKNIQFEDAEPIPLTPEILEKNYFLQNGIGSKILKQRNADNVDETYVWKCPVANVSLYWDKKYYIMEVYGYGINVYGLKIKYVHEFQHALRFCGIKKEIKL